MKRVFLLLLVIACLISVGEGGALAQGKMATLPEADTFGTYAGCLVVARTGKVVLHPTCVPGPNDNWTAAECVKLIPAPSQTDFDKQDISVVRVPGKSTESIYLLIATNTFAYTLFNT